MEPPLGITPQHIWKTQRAIELCQTIERYLSFPNLTIAQHDCIHAWIEELNTINSQLCSRLFALEEKGK